MTYVIGDLHGCFYTLQKLLKKIYRQEQNPQLVFVGDYVDRGRHSKEVVSRVIELQSEGAVCLRGNHDDIIDYLVNGECVSNLRDLMVGTIDQLNVAYWWLVNGLGPTLQNYLNMQLVGNPVDFLLKLFGGIPKEHKEFFRTLKMHWENDTHFACHAYLNPQEALPRDLKFLPDSVNQDMLWTRFPVNRVESGPYGHPAPAGVGCGLPVWDRIGVFGHSLVEAYGTFSPIRHGNLRLIDTGAFDGKYLTAYCCERDDWILEPTDLRDTF